MTTQKNTVWKLTLVALSAMVLSQPASAQSGSKRSYQTSRQTAAQRQAAAQRAEMARKAQMANKDRMKKTRVGLNGYCPVCVVSARKWEKGNPGIASTYDGVTYYFPNQSLKQKFDKAPESFVPALNGDCIVCYEKTGKRVAGNIRFPALHKNRLYLFPSKKEKAMFLAKPARFEMTDLGAKGECIVCLKKAGKHVPGIAKHTVIHDGIRYQFPSASEASMFRKSPANFVTKRDADKGSMKTSMRSSN